jgi:Amt family ammonium transporter
MSFISRILSVAGIAMLIIMIAPSYVLAAQDLNIDPGNTAFILICAALVWVMTPGLALFYGGMVRRKNVLSILMQCFAVIALVSVQWVLIGYTLAFGPDIGSFIGGLDYLGFNGVGITPSPEYASTVPHQVFAVFQLMFAIITTAIISGAFAERMRFSVFVAFILLWVTLVYTPIAHWVWGGGWLGQLGALDFAGGTVVHISSGFSGLVAALVLGKRLGKGRETIMPHNLPMTVLGAALLWIGWFGFNAGSSLAADGIAGLAFLTTNTCAAAGLISWVATEWITQGKPTIFGAVSGGIAGLVAITPAAGFVSPVSAIAMGFMVGPICYLAVSRLKEKFAYDDSLDAFGIHGVGGTFGALATGIFASTAVNPAGADGLLFGNVGQFGVQVLAVLVTYLFAGVMTFLILKGLSLLSSLRVSNTEEEAGLDVSLHGEDAYNQAELGGDGQILGLQS